MGDKLQRDGTIFMGEDDFSRQHVKILIWQLEEGYSHKIWGSSVNKIGSYLIFRQIS